jgi:uncharacterized membrane protein
MNEVWKYGLFFVGGLAVGALGVAAAKNSGLSMKPLAANLLSRSMDARDAVMTSVETVKENVEDIVAEAQQLSEKRKEAQTQES